ncbi:hypothetical protein [Streptomyces sp. cg36]|uniref:hypothetical protein n=1 Tax=Streptomyces sp. cg36 TaxID=3238798 RepID=UPI0034E2BA77
MSAMTNPTAADMNRDVRLAKALVRAPADERAGACRERLGGYLALLAEDAGARVRRMEADRARDVAEGTVRLARHLLVERTGEDPAAVLRLRAGVVEQLLRFGARPL